MLWMSHIIQYMQYRFIHVVFIICCLSTNDLIYQLISCVLCLSNGAQTYNLTGGGAADTKRV